MLDEAYDRRGSRYGKSTLEEGCRRRRGGLWNGAIAPGVALRSRIERLKSERSPLAHASNPEGWGARLPLRTREQDSPSASRESFVGTREWTAVLLSARGLFMVHEESYGIGRTPIRCKSPAGSVKASR